jgi:hypothetical protein
VADPWTKVIQIGIRPWPLPELIQKRASTTRRSSHVARAHAVSGVHGRRLYPVVKTFDASVCRTVRAAVEHAVGFGPMSDDTAVAASTCWGQCVNRTFEAIERMGPSSVDDLKGFVVLVAANFTARHLAFPY